MTLRVVGAGLGRTGTSSLQVALERLLGAKCHHMFEVVANPAQIPVWQAAIDGDLPDWDALLDGYAATVDWPSVAFWAELAEHAPDAVVLLSVRDVDDWWRSASRTILAIGQREPPDDPVFRAQHAMIRDLFERFTPGWEDEAQAKAAYLAHNERVRATIPSSRLLEWTPSDGWAPLCDALGVAVPDEPFPHANTTDDFRAMTGLDGGAST